MLWKNVAKTSTLKALIQTKDFTFHNKFQNSCHNIQIRAFILHISNDFFLNPY
jgi:hypothetical protein